MNTLTQRLTFLALLGISLLFLPACGSKDTVKSQQVAETVLNPEPTAVPTTTSHIAMPTDQTDNGPTSYVEKIKRTKDSKIISTTPSVTEVVTAATPQATPPPAPPMETPAPPVKAKGSGWFWWVLILLAIGGGGWYFWSESRSDNHPHQPNPPTGGLSPVSGFTALKNKNEGNSKTKTSFWFKKLF